MPFECPNTKFECHQRVLKKTVHFFFLYKHSVKGMEENIDVLKQIPLNKLNVFWDILLNSGQTCAVNIVYDNI